MRTLFASLPLCLLALTVFCSIAFAAAPGISAQDIGLDKKQGQKVPLDVPFKDENGKPVTLGDYFKNGKPVILAPVYFKCPMLCTLTLNGLLRAVMSVSFDAGKDYQIVVMSFDPDDKPELALAKKESYVKAYRRDGGAGWHFLTGHKASIDRVTKAIGFRYMRDPKTGQYAHPSAIVVLTASGKISNYLEGVEYTPKDLRLALVDASSNRIGSLSDQILLFCFCHSINSSRYGPEILRAMQVLGMGTVLALGAMIFKLSR